MSKPDVPRWDLAAAYPGFESEPYARDKKRFKKAVESFSRSASDRSTRKDSPEKWLKRCIKTYNTAVDLYENLAAFAYCRYSVNTRDTVATNEISAIDEAAVPLHRAMVVFRNGLHDVRKKVKRVVSDSKSLKKYAFFVEEELFYREHQMSADEEDLAADLSRSGADAWSRLQESISSTLSVPWDESGTKTVVELRSLAHDADRSVREKAYELEIGAWKSMETPIAFALNGVKGTSVVLNKRRSYNSALEKATRQSRISEKALDALIAVMEESLPIFRGYLTTKAHALGLERLAFYDIFAPIGPNTRSWSFQEARGFIVEQFTGFSTDLGEFAEKAFADSWIDAEPRDGKVGGAYCIGFPIAGESRILANFDGTFSGLTTLAHELGHAYHGEVLRKEPAIRRDYPMTLAETASIFCEAIVFNRALASAADGEKAAILEILLQDTTQVIVDILSRFRFERAVFDARKKGELSPDELCALMIDAQKSTYGDALDAEKLHPYMWAVKGHYYRPELSFYNFPYSFGQLFGLALYARYESDPDGFPVRYRKILEETGSASAVDVTRAAGFDIETKEFWRAGISFIEQKANEFTQSVTAVRRA